MSDDTNQPTPGVGSTFTALGEAIALLAQSRIHTCLPATVIAWRPPAGAPPLRLPAVVDVLPDFLTRRSINVPGDATPPEVPLPRATGWEALGPLPQITSVPVAYPGPDGMRSVGPISPGAHGWLYFVERSIDDWMNTGGPVDPAFDYQWHDLSDAIFVPGARFGAVAEDISLAFDFTGSADGGAGMEISTGPAEARTITLRTAGPTATIDALTEIKLGENAVQAVALAEALVAAIDAMLLAGVAVPNDGGASLKATMTAAWEGVKNTIAAIKAKAE